MKKAVAWSGTRDGLDARMRKRKEVRFLVQWMVGMHTQRGHTSGGECLQNMMINTFRTW